jgi:hypothetical protein
VKPVLRAAAVSLGLLCGGATMLDAVAQKAVTETAVAGKIATQETAAPKAAASKTGAPKASKPKAKKPAKPVVTADRLDEVAADQKISQSVVDIAGWVIAADDNRGLPFAIVDKEAAQVLVFGADGKLRGMAPVLLGSATGDTSAEGVGDRELWDIPKNERTTPAGRFLAGFGPAAGGERVLWVDYATAISIHAVPATKASRKEKRTQRLASSKPDDNRITHGCINVSPTFFSKIVKPLFKKGGVFYVLPDSETVREAFPSFAAQRDIAAWEGGNASASAR